MPLQDGSRSSAHHYGRAMIDRYAAKPPYRQAADIIRARIEAGEIVVKLPGERELAEDLGLALGTIRKAIAVLRDEEGLVETSPGWGTFVRGSRQPAARRDDAEPWPSIDP